MTLKTALKAGVGMKKGDIIIIAIVLTLAIVLATVFYIGGDAGKTVIISVNNESVFEGPLSKNEEIDLETNLVVIEDGQVFVKSADCHNQICVRHRPISKKGETIVCLPNKVLIEIK